MRRTMLCAALGLALVPSSAGAQSLMLTESDALARLSTNSPRVRAIRSGVDLARVDVLAATRWPNPRVNVTRESVVGVTEYLALVSQPLPITGRRGLEEQGAAALVLASASRADDEVRRLQTDLRFAFADLVAAQTRERELTTTMDRLRELTDVLANREAAGDAAGFDRLRAERELLDIETDRSVAATDRVRAQAILASFFDNMPDPVANRRGWPVDIADASSPTRGVARAHRVGSGRARGVAARARGCRFCRASG